MIMFDIKKVKKVREAKVRESKHFELSRIKEKGFEKKKKKKKKVSYSRRMNSADMTSFTRPDLSDNFLSNKELTS